MNKVKKNGKGKIFGNPFLELFTRTNPVLHVLTYGGIITFFFYLNQSGPGTATLLFLSGILVWTLAEYLLHRYVFHINESRFQYMIHGIHHEFPRDKERLMMPPVPGILIIALISGGCYLLLYELTPAFMAGFVTAYLLYTFIHYMVHTWKPVRGLKFLWTHHHKHHNPAFEDKAFGVSSPFWDYIFGTMPGHEQVPEKR